MHEKNALAAQNACATEGRCPICGATGEVSEDDRYENVFHLTFRHEPWCAVVSDGEAA